MDSTENDSGGDDFESIHEITKVITNIDLKQVTDEAAIFYTKKEIEKLEEETKSFVERRQKLDVQNDVMQRDLKQLEEDTKVNVKSLELKRQVIGTLPQQIEKCQAEVEEFANKCQTTYKEHKKQYEDAKKIREEYTPLYNDYKEAQTNCLKQEVKMKMLQQTHEDLKKQKKLRERLNRQLSNQSIVKFVKATVDYWKRRDLIVELREAEKQNIEIQKQYNAMKNKSVSQNVQRKMGESSTSNILLESEMDFTESLLPDCSLPISAIPSRISDEDLKKNIQARVQKTKQEWEQRQRSLSRSPSAMKISQAGNAKRYMTQEDNNQRKRITIINNQVVNKISNEQNIPPAQQSNTNIPQFQIPFGVTEINQKDSKTPFNTSSKQTMNKTLNNKNAALIPTVQSNTNISQFQIPFNAPATLSKINQRDLQTNYPFNKISKQTVNVSLNNRNNPSISRIQSNTNIPQLEFPFATPARANEINQNNWQCNNASQPVSQASYTLSQQYSTFPHLSAEEEMPEYNIPVNKAPQPGNTVASPFFQKPQANSGINNVLNASYISDQEHETSFNDVEQYMQLMSPMGRSAVSNENMPLSPMISGNGNENMQMSPLNMTGTDENNQCLGGGTLPTFGFNFNQPNNNQVFGSTPATNLFDMFN